jgi:uncharacterized protein (TIGR00156 family)
MEKFKWIAITAAAAMTLGVGTAQAQFVDAKTSEVTTVKSVLKNGKDDQWVVLEGKVIERIKGDDYRFRDSTGVIEVDIDDEVFKGQKITPDTVVRIEGEVDTELVGDNKIDVERLSVVR